MQSLPMQQLRWVLDKRGHEGWAQKKENIVIYIYIWSWGIWIGIIAHPALGVDQF